MKTEVSGNSTLVYTTLCYTKHNVNNAGLGFSDTVTGDHVHHTFEIISRLTNLKLF